MTTACVDYATDQRVIRPKAREFLGVWTPAFFSKRTKVPFCRALFISKRVFSLDLKGVVPNIFWGPRPQPSFSFPFRERDGNEDHWTSEITIPVNFPHYFFRL